MLIKNVENWMERESAVTPENQYHSRRDILKSMGLGGIGVAALTSGAGLLGGASAAQAAVRPLQYADGGFRLEDDLTPHSAVTGYNNFYEFGTGKEDPARYASALTTEPWTLRVEGECDGTGTYDLEDLIPFNQLQERIYRMRCVEAWSMVIPWVGVPLGDIVRRLQPTSKAKYVYFETALRRGEMPGVRRAVLDWPYKEGLRLDEALNDLAFLAVGLYGETLPNQNGAPLRLVTPWKYGFKGIKSIVTIRFVEDMPMTSWVDSAAQEYGFYANVNPNVDHPRWSQGTERRIGEFRRRKTLMYNGYGAQVAHLYDGMDLRKNY